MAETGRIKRKPEYDADDWEAVGKRKEYVKGLGFKFQETTHFNVNDLSADCRVIVSQLD